MKQRSTGKNKNPSTKLNRKHFFISIWLQHYGTLPHHATAAVDTGATMQPLLLLLHYYSIPLTTIPRLLHYGFYGTITPAQLPYFHNWCQYLLLTVYCCYYHPLLSYIAIMLNYHYTSIILPSITIQYYYYCYHHYYHRPKILGGAPIEKYLEGHTTKL